MPDYRGAGGGMSAGAQDAIRNIRSGNTNYQRNRALQQKAIMTGITTGIDALGNSIKGAHAEADENNRKHDIMASAIEKAKKAQAYDLAGQRAASDKAGATRTDYGTMGPVSSSMDFSKMMDRSVGAGQQAAHDRFAADPYAPGKIDPEDPYAVRDNAKFQLGTMKANEKSVLSPVSIGGKPVWSPGGFEAASTDSAANAQDAHTLGVAAKPDYMDELMKYAPDGVGGSESLLSKVPTEDGMYSGMKNSRMR